MCMVTWEIPRRVRLRVFSFRWEYFVVRVIIYYSSDGKDISHALLHAYLRLQLILGSPIYNLMLAGYYLLLGRYHLAEEDIANRYERYMHLTAILPSVGIAIAGLPLTLYNSSNIWCWIAAWPAGSETFDGQYHSEIEYERGHGAWKFRWLFFYAPLWFVIVACHNGCMNRRKSFNYINAKECRRIKQEEQHKTRRR